MALLPAALVHGDGADPGATTLCRNGPAGNCLRVSKKYIDATHEAEAAIKQKLDASMTQAQEKQAAVYLPAL